jgi:hypothetical protein
MSSQPTKSRGVTRERDSPPATSTILDDGCRIRVRINSCNKMWAYDRYSITADIHAPYIPGTCEATVIDEPIAKGSQSDRNSADPTPSAHVLSRVC